MVACVGQQSVGGRRAPNGFMDRSLPHFPRNAKTPVVCLLSVTLYSFVEFYFVVSFFLIQIFCGIYYSIGTQPCKLPHCFRGLFFWPTFCGLYWPIRLQILSPITWKDPKFHSISRIVMSPLYAFSLSVLLPSLSNEWKLLRMSFTKYFMGGLSTKVTRLIQNIYH